MFRSLNGIRVQFGFGRGDRFVSGEVEALPNAVITFDHPISRLTQQQLTYLIETCRAAKRANRAARDTGVSSYCQE